MEETATSELNRLTKFTLLIILTLAIFGIVMVFSSSYIYAQEVYGRSSYFLIKQFGFLFIAVCVMGVLSKTKLSFWLKYSYYINWFGAILLLMTFMPGFGKTVKGAQRWIYLGSFGFQPSEFIKFSILLTSIDFFERFNIVSNKEKIKYSIAFLAPLGLLLLQPDFGTFSICFMIMAYVCYLSNFPRKVFYYSLAIGIGTIIPILLAQPYRVKRLFTFLDPWKNPQTSGFQIIQSYLAFANGSWFGTGLGNSNEKLFYLPEAHNDFIFSVIGEETGLIGVFAVVLLFFALFYYGQKLASKITTRKHTIVISSVIFLITIQAILNMGVVLGLLPTKGLNLPFISSGGSSLIANGVGLGLLLSAVNEYRKSLVSFDAGNDYNPYYSQQNQFANNQFNNRENQQYSSGMNSSKLPASRLP